MTISESLGYDSWPEDHHLGRLVMAGARLRGQRPFVTFVDETTGERTELGWASLENWSAKAANLLVEELVLGPGDVLATDLGTHWTSLVLLVAAWRAGVILALPGAGAGASAWAVHEGAPRPEGPHLVTGRGMGGRMAGDPEPGLGFAEEVLAYPDLFDDHAGDADDPALLVPSAQGPVARSHRDLLQAARGLSERAGLRAGDRHLSAVPVDVEHGAVAAGALVLGLAGGVVLARGASPARLAGLAADERCRALVLDRSSEHPSTDLPVVVC